jgi:hypothetical protein
MTNILTHIELCVRPTMSVWLDSDSDTDFLLIGSRELYAVIAGSRLAGNQLLPEIDLLYDIGRMVREVR